MKKVILLTAAMVMIVTALSGCGAANGGKVTIYAYNWSGYIDDDICKRFEEETGIAVRYDNFDTNEAMYTDIKNNNSSYDVLFPSEYMIERMIKEGLLQKINTAENISNFKYIDDHFKGLRCDPNNEYFVAYMWGTVGILYNKARVTEPVDSWNILWDKKYSKKIFMLDSERDAIGVTLKLLGYSLNTTDTNELNEAKRLLIEQKPLTLAYTSENIMKDKMVGNEGDMCVIYSGDALYAMMYSDDLDYAIPLEGSNVWYDGMVVPKNAKRPKEAQMFINYLTDPKIAAEQSNKTGYSTANREAVQYLDDFMQNSEVYWPDDATLDRCEMFLDLGEDKRKYDTLWNDILTN